MSPFSNQPSNPPPSTPPPSLHPTTPFPPTSVKPAYRYTAWDMRLSVILWAVGYLICATIPVLSHPIPAFLLQVLLFVGGAFLVTRPTMGGKLTPRAIPVIASSLALSLSFLLTTNTALVGLVFVWNVLSWFYLVFVLTGNSQETAPGDLLVGEMLSATFRMPFRAPGHLFGALFGRHYNEDGTPRPRGRIVPIVGWCLLGLGIAVIPTLIVGSLLSYDQGFSSLLDRLFTDIFSKTSIFRQLRHILFGLPVGALLFGALLACRLHCDPRKKAPAPQADALNGAYTFPATPTATLPSTSIGVPRLDGAHILPVALVAAALTPILVLYAIFFFSQWDYYVSAFTGVRPEELTFADYAREGFFQLLAVSIINGVLWLLATLLSIRRPTDPDRPHRDRTNPVIRVYSAVLSFCTLVLIATAISKMVLYVSTYGMTRKRVWATWLMLLLAVAFLIILVRQFVSRINVPAALLTTLMAFSILVSVINVDSHILHYNVNAALDGNLRTMSGDVASDVGLSGVAAALRFMEETEDPTTLSTVYDEQALESLRRQTAIYLCAMATEVEDLKWYEHNPVTLRARAALREAGIKPDTAVPNGDRIPADPAPSDETTKADTP